MSNLTLFNPFSKITHFDPLWDMDDMFDRMMMRPAWREMEAAEPQIRMDVSEADDAYTVKAEIPGVKKEDIHVTIDRNQVCISAEIKQEKEVKEGERMVRCERSYGKAMRSFRLDQDVNPDAVQAKYADGVLELKMPKKVVAAQKEVMIS